MSDDKAFSGKLTAWHRRHGRHDLPWQGTNDPYRIWLSEIMLQQTQVAAVIPYYRRFLEHYPTLTELAAAPVEEVMGLWSGLGYYARARNLHRCAQVVMDRHAGAFPQNPDVIAQLPGIGRSTANAIAAFCFGARAAILDGNVKRVLCRTHGIEGYPGVPAVEKILWSLAESLLPRRDSATYIQALMDLGATVCTRGKPRCLAEEKNCPVVDQCVARKQGRIAELPVARPRKILPQRETRVLLLLDGDKVLLERRPPSGIWGGLLSLPELPVGADPLAYAARTLGCEVTRFMTLPPLHHSFTHFHLTLLPLSGAAKLLPHTAEAAGHCWLGSVEIGAAALPAPIRKILSAAFQAGSAR
ncbi:MAG: A/G-specific adenine glycosylase [Betaproteobacteria bacterium]|nr:A/G-specific adenine glycosylase [Betaproteobacteria bacterium]